MSSILMETIIIIGQTTLDAEIPTETPFAESIRRMIKESVRRALNEMDLTYNQNQKYHRHYR